MFNRSIPSATIIPTLAYDDVPAAADWLCRVFGLSRRITAGDSHVQLTFGEGAVFLTKSRVGQGFASAEDTTAIRQPRPREVTVSLLIRVDDVEAHHRHAANSGARILQPPETHMYGERQYTAEDLAGYRWTFTQSVEDVDPTSWGAKVS